MLSRRRNKKIFNVAFFAPLRETYLSQRRNGRKDKFLTVALFAPLRETISRDITTNAKGNDYERK